MVLRSSGNRELSRFERKKLKFKRRLRDHLVEEAIIEDNQYRSVFVCENSAEAYRAVSLWIKERGTMDWLDSNLKPGDHFLDIGANIGIYTISAAHRVGASGRVVSVEPHKANALSLMRNIERNGFTDRVDVLAFPVTDGPTVERFNYLSLIAASSGSQLGSTSLVESDKEFSPVGSELCIGTSIDDLIDAGSMRAPDLVKIDVDGIEIRILNGMDRLLRSGNRPRSVQVELNVGEQDEIVDFMSERGYVLRTRHHTKAGEEKQRKGSELSDIAHNAVFSPD